MGPLPEICWAPFFETNPTCHQRPSGQSETGVGKCPFLGTLNVTKPNICWRLSPKYFGDMKHWDIYQPLWKLIRGWLSNLSTNPQIQPALSTDMQGFLSSPITTAEINSIRMSEKSPWFSFQFIKIIVKSPRAICWKITKTISWFKALLEFLIMMKS